MRRPLISRAPGRIWRVVAWALVAFAAAAPLRAQGGVATGGALELLLPVGAQATGMGEAVVADFLGSESIWWNPAGMARATQREIAIHHTQTFALTGDALSAVLPTGGIGTVALSADLYSYGTQDNTDVTGALGTFTPRATILAATFAGHVGSRAELGINYKHYQRGINCSGGCSNLPTQSTATTAIDLGVQVRLSTDSSLYMGAALRNVGPRLQVNDAPQADPLPTRLDIGLTYAPRLASLPPEADVKFAVGVVNAIPASGIGFRLGADLGWQHRVHVRAGYTHLGPGGSGPTFGVGASTGRLFLDIARQFSDNVANTSQPPTYLSLRVVF